MKTSVRAMPSNQDAERAVLGAILLGGANILEKAQTSIRNKEAFYWVDHQRIWEASNKLYKDNKPIDSITVLSDIKDTFKDGEVSAYFITGLPDDVPTTSNIEHYAKIVWHKYIQREAVKSSHKLYDISMEHSEDVPAILHKHERLIEELKDLTPIKLNDTSVILDDTILALRTGANIIPYGIECLDSASGGMTRGEVTVIGGRPGHGKTTLVINVVKRLLEQGYKVMLFNREMNNTEMMKKMIVMEFPNLSYEKIRKAEDIDKEIAEINMCKDDLGKKFENLIMYDDIKTLAEGLKEVAREKPDVVIDDYIQLIRLDEIKKDRRFEIEDIMLEYKWISKKIECSSILVSQLNREIERRIDAKPKLSDFAESGVIEQTAEAAYFKYYPFAVHDQENDPHEVEIICQKARFGELGSYTMGFNGDKCRVYFDRQEAIRAMKPEK